MKGDENWTMRMKRERLDRTIAICKAAQPVKFEKLVALVSYNLGVKAEKAREYITTMLQLDALKMENGEVSVV